VSVCTNPVKSSQPIDAEQRSPLRKFLLFMASQPTAGLLLRRSIATKLRILGSLAKGRPADFSYNNSDSNAAEKRLT
jgi:hypothetical protein